MSACVLSVTKRSFAVSTPALAVSQPAGCGETARSPCTSASPAGRATSPGHPRLVDQLDAHLALGERAEELLTHAVARAREHDAPRGGGDRDAAEALGDRAGGRQRDDRLLRGDGDGRDGHVDRLGREDVVALGL